MAKVSKRYNKAMEEASRETSRSLADAVQTLQNLPAAKFDETVEISANLGVDPKNSSQMVRGVISLPHGSGKSVRVVVFTENPEEARENGADEAGLDDLINKIQEGWTDFDVAIATTEAMKKVRSVARILGPKGLMPNPKSGTVTDDVPGGIQAVKAGRVEYKLDKGANVAIVIGKRSFSAEQLVENAQAAMESLGQARPDGFKGRYLKNIAISSSMSPGVRIASGEFGQ
ncbi:MAG: 50S ribosomal protein L1 [Opitutales bacterium]|nr:50S ribosomal protein L1 [Opitutales bacterium]|tara:strand:+ start:1640 stop:2329 length:690 start_codon:yes stop_codon:yes gene_type:complete